jgi:hypothetical protein
MWYSDPAWYALVVSMIALALSSFTYRHNLRTLKHAQRTTKSEIQRKLLDRAMEINNAFVNFGVQSPYGHHFGIPREAAQEFNAKAVVLFHQMAMLRDVHENRDVLGKEILEHYERWANTHLRPWIEADRDLKRILKLDLETEDLMDAEFVSWAKRLLPVIDVSELSRSKK